MLSVVEVIYLFDVIFVDGRTHLRVGESSDDILMLRSFRTGRDILDKTLERIF